MNENQKRSYEIVWQSAMKAAVDLIPESKKGTDEGFKLYEKYHSAIYKKFCTFNDKLSEKK
jgi:hypothetical protein